MKRACQTSSQLAFDVEGTLLASNFTDITGGKKYGEDARILWNADKRALLCDADGSDTASKAVAFAILDNKSAGLDHTDFVSTAIFQV